MSAGSKQHEPHSGGLLKRLIFWDFPRASWRYDVAVGLILAFIFATPREWFRDQPKASSIILMSSLHHSERVFIATDLLENVLDNARPAQAEALIRQTDGQNLARGPRGTDTRRSRARDQGLYRVYGAVIRLPPYEL